MSTWTVEQELAAQQRDRKMRDDYWAGAGLPVDVMNLKTGAIKTYIGSSPRMAVIAAYAQSRNDWNTWNYEAWYGHLIETASTPGRLANVCLTIGDWSVFADGRRINTSE